MRSFADALDEGNVPVLVEFFDCTTDAQHVHAEALAKFFLAHIHIFAALRDHVGKVEAGVFQRSTGNYGADDYRGMAKAEWHIDGNQAWCMPGVFGDRKVVLVQKNSKWTIPISTRDGDRDPEGEKRTLEVLQKIAQALDETTNEIVAGKLVSLQSAQQRLEEKTRGMGFATTQESR